MSLYTGCECREYRPIRNNACECGHPSIDHQVGFVERPCLVGPRPASSGGAQDAG